jgi:hypothetical protein
MIFSPFAYKQQIISGGVPLDPDAENYLDAVISAGGSYTSTQETAVNNLFVSLKNAGLYSYLIAMYPLVGGTSSSHAINACNIGTFTLTFFGGWTHTTSGITANGSTSYATTNCVPRIDIPFPNAHFSFRQTQTSPANVGWDGYYKPANGKVFGCNLTTGGQLGLGLWFLSGSLGAISDYTTVMTGVKSANNVGVFYTNNTAFYTDTETRTDFSGPEYSSGYFIGALSENGTANYYNNNIYNFYTLGYAIPSGNIGTWSTIWNTYITEMGR